MISEHILAETERALAKPYVRQRMTPIRAEDAVRLVLTESRVTALTALTATIVGVASHWEDDLVLATAVSAHVLCVVTGDREPLAVGHHRGVQSVTARAFLEVLHWWGWGGRASSTDFPAGRPRPYIPDTCRCR